MSRPAIEASWAVPGDRDRIRWVLLAVLILVGVNALYGGIGLMLNGMGMPPEWLSRTPFSSWFWPGVALLITVAAPQFGAAALLVRGHGWAALSGLVVGLGLIAWIAVQVLVLQRYFFLQPVIAVLGSGEVLLALWWVSRVRHRHQPGSATGLA